MTCNSCASHIKATLEAIDGVQHVDVSYEKARAAVNSTASVRAVNIIGAIVALGYSADESREPADNSTSNATSATGGNGVKHVAIIGSGSGAFACAIKAAEGGANVTIIERL